MATTSWHWGKAEAVESVDDREDTVIRNGAREEVAHVVAHATLSLVGCSARAAAEDPQPRARWVKVDVTQPLVAGTASESALDRRIAGLTLDAMIAGLEHLALVPHDPEKAEFLVRATGLLLQHPEYSDALVPIATQSGLGLEGRMVVLDVLASVGHDSAQAALRDALDHRALRADELGYNTLVQRLSFVSAPTDESLAWLEREWGKRGAAIGTAAALGSVAGRSFASGREREARPAVEALAHSVEAARDVNRKADLLLALGNVRSPIVAPVLLRESKSKVPEARAAAAFALRGVDLPQAREALVELARDPLPSVALAAYAALDSQALEKPKLEALITDVIEGRVPASAEASVVTYLGKHLNESPFVVDALKAIAGRAENPEVKARAVALLRTTDTAL